MKLCPLCKTELNIGLVSIASTDFTYSCSGTDHQYRECYDLNRYIYGADTLQWIELEIQERVYYGNDVLKICNLMAFI